MKAAAAIAGNIAKYFGLSQSNSEKFSNIPKLETTVDAISPTANNVSMKKNSKCPLLNK